MTESRLDSCRQDFKVQNRTSVSLPSTEGGAALPGGSEAQPTGTLRAKVPCHRGCRRTRPGCSLRAGTNRAGAGRAGALTASRPIAVGPWSPGGAGAAGGTCRGCADARARGRAERARSVWRRQRCLDRQTCRERSTARSSAAGAAPARPPVRPPWCRGSSPGWWCKWPLLRLFFPSLRVSQVPLGPRAPASHQPRVARAINTRRSLNLAGTVAAWGRGVCEEA